MMVLDECGRTLHEVFMDDLRFLALEDAAILAMRAFVQVFMADLRCLALEDAAILTTRVGPGLMSISSGERDTWDRCRFQSRSGDVPHYSSQPPLLLTQYGTDDPYEV
ncbi:hypothetical protein EYF80_043468 [Liparis tanakae]|uniref:Uncharacterized protein n=1 Tax=Liparis tanakae TaxID=230148 RepID=A0A4Z2FYK3_9TELE|nr:hypothetical protein EYF80_043468 [Liparis tanakae]